MPSAFINSDTIGLRVLDGNFQSALITRTGTLRNNDSVIISSGFATSIINNGEIISVTAGANIGTAALRVDAGRADIVNNGFLVSTNGGYAVAVNAGGARVTNNGAIVGRVLLGAEDITTEVVNTGTISGQVEAGPDVGLRLSNTGTISDLGVAVFGGGLADTVTNAGRVNGDVALALGNDLYDGTLGFVTGRIEGSDGNDTLIGGGGADAMSGGADDDLLRGGFGDDSLAGDNGDDILDGGAGNDTLAGEAGLDELRGGDGDDLLVAGTDGAGDLLDGGNGFDLVDFRAVTLGFLLDLTTPTSNTGAADIDALVGIEGAYGGAGNDTLLGTNTANLLYGMAGEDSLDGRAGNDTMAGGTGGDTYRVDSASDVVLERADQGVDIILTTVSYRLGAGWEVETLQADTTVTAVANAALNLWGSSIPNSISGTGGVNRLFGRGGNDTVYGLGGNDFLYGEAGADRLLGGAGVDRLFGGDDDDDLFGGDDADSLMGEAGQDSLFGEAGNDTLSGGPGAVQDVLEGGTGNDAFVLDTPLPGHDILADFTPGFDRIWLKQSLATGMPLGGVGAAAFASGPAFVPFSTPAQRLFYNTTTGTLSFDPDGNGDLPGTTIATLSGAPAGVASTDFFIVA